MADDQKTEQDEVEAHQFEGQLEGQADLNRGDDGPDVEGHRQMEGQMEGQIVELQIED